MNTAAGLASSRDSSVTVPAPLEAAAAALRANRLPVAEQLLRQHLAQHPSDVAATHMLAEIAWRLGQYTHAETLLRRCVGLAPAATTSRHNLAMVLMHQDRLEEALAEIEAAAASEPRNAGHRNLKAAILMRIGECDEAIALYEEVLAEHPEQAGVWLNYGHALRAAGRRDECVAAYRHTLEERSTCGEAWWSLANLKTWRFDDADRASIRAALEAPDLDDADRLHLHFALGKALEDAGDHAAAFRQYEEANRLRRRTLHYSADETSLHVQRSLNLFTSAFFEARRGSGAAAADPIFIVGLPRSGSTLVEQILSSHPQVEGTRELPNIMGLARGLLERQARSGVATYLDAIAGLDPGELRDLGERYLSTTRVLRRAGTPRFIDKMPANFLHLGFIHLILPNAAIIDVRRHPLACCVSAFKQHFALGNAYSNDLGDLGRYYADYVALMQHFDDVLPGRVCRVHYEALVADLEGEVRRLLDYCRLPFDERCLRFFENPRPVHTPSADQVRTPLFREGVDHWRHYERWLDPLKQALGRLVEEYPYP